MRPTRSRADLIRCLHHQGERGLQQGAAAAGYVGITPEPEDRILEPPTVVFQVRPAQTNTAPDQGDPPAVLYAVTAQENLPPEQSITEKPAWFERAMPLQRDEAAAKTALAAPEKLALMRNARLWPFIRQVLGAQRDTSALNMGKIVRQLSQGRVLSQLPYRQASGWALRVHVVLDMSPRLTPFWTDFNQLCARIQRFYGQAGLSIWVFEHGPMGPCRLWRQSHYYAAYPMPAVGVPVLVLSDLGCYAPSATAGREWLARGRQWRRAGCAVVALSPCPPRLWQDPVCALFNAVCWDKNTHLPRAISAPRVCPKVAEPVSQGVHDLLTILSPAIRIEPELLRAARAVLAKPTADVGSEGEAWLHADMQASVLCLTYSAEASQRYRAAFSQLGHAEQQRALDLIQQQHAHLSEAVLVEEAVTAQVLMGQAPDEAFIQRAVKTLDEATFPAFERWAKRLIERQCRAAWAHSDALAALYAMTYKKALQAGDKTLPAGLSRQRIAWVLDADESITPYEVWQRGEALILLPPQAQTAGDWQTGSRLGCIDVARGCEVQQAGAPALSITVQPGRRLALPKTRMTLTGAHTQLTLSEMQKPTWASALGQDAYGFFAECRLNAVRQRLRWIAPGTFLMGSPDSEANRHEHERQHTVTLTHGYWLADTQCTQALWQAVMGQNPSQFNGEQHPVERVSWEDVQTFLDKTEQLCPGLALRLPSEAEWEYACRAETLTPFSWGQQITSEQVNFDGNHPYAGAEKSAYREETVAVQSLPVNPWGVYEMHGNVMEWCADWYGAYAGRAESNPAGSETGKSRVVRGGSWFDDAHDARSAYRIRISPGFRYDSLGFRFARDPSPQDPAASQ